MMFKNCSNFHWCSLRGLNFIGTVYELFDNPSYILITSFLNINLPKKCYIDCRWKWKLHSIKSQRFQDVYWKLLWKISICLYLNFLFDENLIANIIRVQKLFFTFICIISMKYKVPLFKLALLRLNAIISAMYFERYQNWPYRRYMALTLPICD